LLDYEFISLGSGVELIPAPSIEPIIYEDERGVVGFVPSTGFHILALCDVQIGQHNQRKKLEI